MNNKEITQPRILVAGAGGQLGYRVAEILIEQGYTSLVVASRNPDKLNKFAARGIEVRTADYNHPLSLSEAFKGIDKLLLISTDDLHDPGARIRQHTNAIAAAKTAGISHIVYTSMPSPDLAHDIPFAPDHVATEQALEKSGLDFTSLRVSWYTENLLGFLPQIIAAGRWPTVAGNGRISYLAREDVAQVTVATLVKSAGKSYPDVSGTDSLSITEIAGIASGIFHKTINVVQVADTAIHDELVAIGIPAAVAQTVIMTDLNTRAGNFDKVTDVAEHAIGRSPATLKSFLTSQKSKFIS